jgi:hypothetical protein
MSTPSRCVTCDRPLAPASTIAEWKRGGIYCETIEARDGVCLSPRSDYCIARAVDWRTLFLGAQPDALRWNRVAPTIETLREIDREANAPGTSDARIRELRSQMFDTLRELLAIKVTP